MNGNVHWTFPFLNSESAALLAPYAFAPLVLSVLLGRNHGLYAAVFVSLWTRLLFGRFDAPLLACALLSGFTAVFLTLQVRRRSRLVRAGFGVWHRAWLSLARLRRHRARSISSRPGANDWQMLAIQSALAIGNGILTATIVGGCCRFSNNSSVSRLDISWLEASDLNHPLLARMTIEAPGHVSPQPGGGEPRGSSRRSHRGERNALSRLRLFPRCREAREAGLLHREHELRAQSAR
jgi:membrane-associated HD superfamily phosphohydrolase